MWERYWQRSQKDPPQGVSVIPVAMGGDVVAIGAGVMQHKAALGVDRRFMGGKQPVKLEHGYCVEYFHAW